MTCTKFYICVYTKSCFQRDSVWIGFCANKRWLTILNWLQINQSVLVWSSMSRRDAEYEMYVCGIGVSSFCDLLSSLSFIFHSIQMSNWWDVRNQHNSTSTVDIDDVFCQMAHDSLPSSLLFDWNFSKTSFILLSYGKCRVCVESKASKRERKKYNFLWHH